MQSVPLGSYTLVYDFNALCEAETLIGPLGQAMPLIARGSLSTTRALLWAGLQAKHDFTLEKAGEIVVEIGFPKVSAAIADAVALAFPDGGNENGKKPIQA